MIKISGIFKKVYNIFNKIKIFFQILVLSLKYRLVISISTILIVLSVIYNVFDFEKLKLVESNDFLKSCVSFFVNNSFVAIILLIIAIIVYVLFIYQYKLKTYTFKKNSNEHIKIMKKNLILSDELIESGYKIHVGNFGKEMYVASDQVNDFLRNHADEILLKDAKTDYKIPNKLLNYVPSLLDRKLKSTSVVFNGKHLGLQDEIFPDIKSLDCWKVSYFESQVTDEIIYYQLFDTRESFEKVEGVLLACEIENDTYILKPNYKNSCTNYMGVSTVLITSDNYAILQVQGKDSNVNANNFAPSGSGSVDYSDYKKSKNKTLENILKSAVERELLEEFGIKRGVLQLNTHIIGYAKLIERGGKPDFFAVTKCDYTKEEIIKLVESGRLGFSEAGLSNLEKEPVLLNLDDDKGLLNNFIEEHKDRQSIQNIIFNNFLKREDVV